MKTESVSNNLGGAGQHNKMLQVYQILFQMSERYPDYEFNFKDTANNGWNEFHVVDEEMGRLMVIEFKQNQKPVVLQLLKNDGFKSHECRAIMNDLLEFF